MPNKLAKLNFINIYPASVIDNDEIIVIFPYKPTKKQLETLKNLYDQLSNPNYRVYYFEKPNDELYLDYDELKKEGIESLKDFVKKKELLIEQNYQERY